eukprot:gene3774-4353_t
MVHQLLSLQHSPYGRQQQQYQKRTLPEIDHSLFDPRGIRDYSSIKKPIGGVLRGNNRRDDDYYEEVGTTLRVKNIAPSVTLSDLGRVFGVIGPLRDFDLLVHLTPVQASITYRLRKDAESALERFNGIGLDAEDGDQMEDDETM